MRRLIAFNNLSLDGFFTDRNSDINWVRKDAETAAFAAEKARAGDTLLFGRKTYELMAGFWPTPVAVKSDSVMAELMNASPKVVFSRTLDKASWSNTELVKDDLPDAVRKMKQRPGNQMAILGSGSIVAQLAAHGLIDEYQVMVNPVVLGRGRTMFDGIKEKLTLRLIKTRVFNNGNVLLCYEPAK
jgi:dihydrofolate reductase